MPRLTFMLRAILVSLFLVATGLAQPSFEAASIKPATRNDNSSSTRSRNGRLTMENLTIKQIVMTAYNLRNHEYAGPAWMEDLRYDIEAKADEKVPDKELNQMLQTLLAERFKLKVHHESKMVSGYALVVAKGGPKIKPVEGTGSSTNSNNNKLTATHINMERLARYLSNLLNQPVEDQTGLKDSYSFVLEYELPRPGREEKETNLPTIFTALPETLGLKLEPRKVSVDVVVVDSCERPTEN